MKKFYDFSEALILSVKPASDAVGAASPCCGKPATDMFSTTAEDYMKNILGGGNDNADVIQPDDDVGEAGEVSADSESSVSVECMGEEGLRVKFNGMEFVLPVEVVEAIKNSEGSEADESEEHEESETPEEEAEEQAEGDDDEEEEVKNESAKKGKFVNPWAVCNKSTGGKKKAGNAKFEKCVKAVKAKNKFKK